MLARRLPAADSSFNARSNLSFNHNRCFHVKRLTLLVLEKANMDIILRCPWLAQHHPDIHWTTGNILRWSKRCQAECLKNLPESRRVPGIPGRLQQGRGYPPSTTSAMGLYDPFAAWGHVYPLLIPGQATMEEYVQEAVQQGFIRLSTSPAASSFFFVANKDGELRPCIDYRALNAQTVKSTYPLPLIPASLEALREARVFTKLDLRSAYNLIRFRKGDEWKTAFVTPTGHYEYQVMPYGLSNSPSIFQNFLNKIFRDMLNQFIIIYTDDILIYSPNLEEHCHHVTQVLERLHQHHLFLKGEKCEFQLLCTFSATDGSGVDYWFRESERVWDSAHVHLQRAVQRHKQYTDARRSATPSYQPGYLLCLSTRDVCLHLPSRKLSPRYIGPFPIARQINEVTYELQLPAHYRIAPTFHVSLLKPHINPLLPPSTENKVHPPPEIDPNGSIYKV
ncbi:hypothetical protein M9458_056811 [Cirrhinus mrigala]|uniref:ribonuclease H n=1 Tax=Cirrhinus mrigala TaxID=683832 RepID=A0ABD0MCD7_CIRMR